MLTAQQFVQRWNTAELKETAAYVSHFEDVCQLIQHPVPVEIDPKGEFFTYQRLVEKTSGKQGYADVWYKGHFAIEYKTKGKYKDLKEAYTQLLQYRENLHNPPLLVVCDFERWEIHTNFNNTPPHVYVFTNADLVKPNILRLLRDMFYDPERLRPDQNKIEVTGEAAAKFKDIVDNMRDWEAAPERIARFLTKLVFCLFAEDVGLLPTGPKGQRGIFAEIVEETRHDRDKFVRYVEELFRAMAEGGEMLMREIPYFNGTLFDDVQVERLGVKALNELDKASHLDWKGVEPVVFGTLFERSLDPAKRKQLGAHYTSKEDILLIVEPVLMQPLRREWEEVKSQTATIHAFYESATTTRAKTERESELVSLRSHILNRVRKIKVLDPACGSGNFLYVALQLLMDLEKEIINHPFWAKLEPETIQVHPRQLYGIETDPIAHALASIVAWIGYLQWRQNNGYWSVSKPILSKMEGNIVCMDAILNPDGTEPEWPEVDVIVGNPPWLGSRKLRPQLGDKYMNNLEKLFFMSFGDSTPDLVCYWYEKALHQILDGRAKRVGLLATNSIRGGTNRLVLEHISAHGQIFEAWSDRDWILEGAAVRSSIVCFDQGEEKVIRLDGFSVPKINPDLTADIDLTAAKVLEASQGISFQGIVKRGSFDLTEAEAYQMIQADSMNSRVLKPIYNGIDIVRHPRMTWIVDFGVNTSIEEAQEFLLPFQYVERNVKPERLKTGNSDAIATWWLHWRPRREMRQAIQDLSRYIATPAVSKHFIMAWLSKEIHPDHSLIIFAREDDYFFGVLHSHLHEVWSLRMGTWLGKGNDPRYTPTTTFETFPFPWSPGHEDTSSPAYHAISEAAKRLHQERDAWLNPPNATEKDLQKRTLTNLYNALNVWRGKESIKVPTAAADFAPRLDELHHALDRAVCDAYGWEHAILEDEEEILRRLLALNLERAAQEAEQNE